MLHTHVLVRIMIIQNNNKIKLLIALILSCKVIPNECFPGNDPEPYFTRKSEENGHSHSQFNTRPSTAVVPTNGNGIRQARPKTSTLRKSSSVDVEN